MTELTQEQLEETTVPDDSTLRSIANLIERQQELEDEIAAGQQVMKELQKGLAQISEHDLPDAMAAAGLSSIVSADGSQVTVDGVLRASIKKTNQEEAFAWLRDNDFGDLIKHVMVASFGAGEDSSAKEFAELVNDLGLELEDKETVHPQTLGAWAREQIADGVDIPKELLGVWEGSKTKIVRNRTYRS